MQQTEVAKPIRRPQASGQIILWGVLASMAAIYLGIAVARPDLLTDAMRQGRQAQPQSNEGQRALSEAMAELKSLQESINQVQLEVSSLRTEVASRAERDQDLLTRVAALETKPGKPVQQAAATKATAKAAAAPVATAAAVAPTAPAPQAPKAVAAVSTPAANSGSGVKLINAPLTADGQVVTGSVAAPAAAAAPVDFGTAVVTPAPTVSNATKPFGVQIARGPSVDSLRLSWNLLTDRHSSELQQLQPRYTSAPDANGEAFELVAGPVKNAADAQRICKELLAKAVPCKVSDFTGDAL